MDIIYTECKCIKLDLSCGVRSNVNKTELKYERKHFHTINYLNAQNK